MLRTRPAYPPEFEPQTSQMAASALQLVVPTPVQATYRPAQRGWLMNLAGFLDEVARRRER